MHNGKNRRLPPPESQRPRDCAGAQRSVYGEGHPPNQQVESIRGKTAKDEDSGHLSSPRELAERQSRRQTIAPADQTNYPIFPLIASCCTWKARCYLHRYRVYGSTFGPCILSSHSPGLVP